MAKVAISGVDPSLFTFKYLERAGGANTWTEFDPSTPQGFAAGAAGFPLSNDTLQISITPKTGAEGSVLTYKISLLQVLDGQLTSNVVAETTTGEIEIAAAGKPYTGCNIPAYDANSGSLFLSFEDFDTIEKLVARLNATGEFAAVQLETDSNVAANELDAVIAQDIKSDPYTLKSDFYALVHALQNGVYVGDGNVEKADDAPNTLPDNDSDFA
jgi:hypothetical protein